MKAIIYQITDDSSGVRDYMGKNTRTVNSAKNLTAMLLSQGLSIILKFVGRTVFIYTLGKNYLGINGLFSDILTMLSLAELGLDTAITYRLYKPIAENDYERLRVLFKFYKYAYFVIGLVILTAGALLIPFLPNLIKDYSTLYELGINPVFIFLLYLFNAASSYLFFAYKSAIIRAAQKMYIATIVSMVVSVISQAVQIAILYLFKDFTLYVSVSIAFNIITNWICSIIAKKMYPEVFIRTDKRINKNEIKDIFKDLGAVFVAKVNGVILKGTDNIVLSAFIGIATVGLYSNYLMLYTTIKSLLTGVYNATKASMGDLFAQSDLKTKHSFFKLMNFITIILYGTAAVGVGVLANELIDTWIGEEYLIAFPFSTLIGVEILFVGIKQNLNQIRNVSGLFRQMWMRPLLGTIINLAVSIALVKPLGIFGVIIGTITADITTNFAIDPKIIYKYGFNGEWKVSEYYFRNVRYIVELSVVGTADFFICKYFLVGMGWLSVISHAIICALSIPLYMLVVYRKTNEARYVFNKGKAVFRKLKLAK